MSTKYHNIYTLDVTVTSLWFTFLSIFGNSRECLYLNTTLGLRLLCTVTSMSMRNRLLREISDLIPTGSLTSFRGKLGRTKIHFITERLILRDAFFYFPRVTSLCNFHYGPLPDSLLPRLISSSTHEERVGGLFFSWQSHLVGTQNPCESVQGFNSIAWSAS